MVSVSTPPNFSIVFTDGMLLAYVVIVTLSIPFDVITGEISSNALYA